MTPRFLSLTAAAAAFALAPLSLEALENVRVGVIEASEETRSLLQNRLEGASLTRQALEEGDVNVQDLIGAARAEYGRMLAVLYEQGFYGPTIVVTADGVEVTAIDVFNPPAQIREVVIAVRPGPRFVFGRTDLRPRATQATRQPIVDGFETGQVALGSLVVSAASAGVREWRAEGHAKADVEGDEIIANHRSNQLDVSIRLDPGPRLRFGDVTVVPGSEVSERRVREIMGFPHGEVFSPEQLRVAGNRLRRVGVFRTVSLIEAETPNPDGTLDYTLTVLDEKKRRIGVRADFSTLDGFTVGGFWMHRNVFGGGERFRLDADIEGIASDEISIGGNSDRGTTYRVQGRLTRPATFGPDNDVYAYFLAERPDEEDYTETSFAVAAGISRYFSDRLYGEIALGYRYSEAEDVFTELEAIETGTPERVREFQHVIAPGRLEWDLRDDIGNPTRGAYFNTYVTPYFGLGDSDSGARATLDARGYLGFGPERRLVLAGRTQLGSIVGSAIDDTPPSFLFYSGGGNTVRGQAFESLGIEVGDVGQSGGRSFLGLSGEIRGRVTSALGLVAFYDYGYISADSTPGTDGVFHAGAGLGVRYDTPIGPIRVDLATPVAGDTRDPYESVELYIGVGQAF